MKIVAQNPTDFLSGAIPDSSRVAHRIQRISPEELAKLPHGIVILGLADDTGVQNVGGRTGAKEGPQALRERLYRFTTQDFPAAVYDLGDLHPTGSVEDTHKQATQLLRQALRAGHLPVVLGGGHDLAFAEARALLEEQGGRINFLNVDAHLDLRDTSRGITSGSPWYLLLREKSFHKNNCKLVEFGIQDHCNSPALFAHAHAHKVDIHRLEKIRAAGSAEKQFSRLLSSAAKAAPTLVSIDIDSVQASQAPGCSAAQVMGFTAAEVIAFARAAGAESRVRSFGLYELSPVLDPAKLTAQLAAHCIHAFLLGTLQRRGGTIGSWPAKIPAKKTTRR